VPVAARALAKLAVKAPLGDGVVGMLATLSAAGTTMLMLHFLRRLASTASDDSGSTAPLGLTAPWLATAIASVAVPWALYPAVTGSGWSDVLSPVEIGAALWPVALGAALAAGLWRFGNSLPRVPEGDVVVVGAWSMRAARVGGDALERTEESLAVAGGGGRPPGPGGHPRWSAVGR
jgi:hypothetical protein